MSNVCNFVCTMLPCDVNHITLGNTPVLRVQENRFIHVIIIFYIINTVHDKYFLLRVSINTLLNFNITFTLLWAARCKTEPFFQQLDLITQEKKHFAIFFSGFITSHRFCIPYLYHMVQTSCDVVCSLT